MKTKELSAAVSAIIERVKRDGDRALLYYGRKFDRVKLQAKNIKVSQSEIGKSGSQIDAALKKAIDTAATNIRRFHQEELKHIHKSWSIRTNGIVRGRVVTPIAKAGIYVPGGRFSYPSTVLMSAIPARTAGVEKVVMVTPPGKLTPAVLYAARISGVDEIFRVGGPQAVAALAFGTGTIPKVDIIVGPGNAFVNEAKRQVYGAVGIDSLAGPSEVAIIADDTAPAEFICADLEAQAEHDPLARAYLLTSSRELARKVKAALPAALSRQIVITFCALPEAVSRLNGIAPEHLEIMTRTPEKVAGAVRNAGAVFIGSYTPTAVGDYWAGPSHILPTAGTARFASVLSVETFLKRTSRIGYGPRSIQQAAPFVETMAQAEGLEYHRRSIAIRRRA
jgi:histidinol dehydrogenase